jgi:hypothetical protein
MPLPRLFVKRTLLLAALAVPVMLATGCGNMVTTATGIGSTSSVATVSGHIHGGNQPISGSVVTLYAAGATGYGSVATLYATTTSANDGYGSFSFTKSATNSGIVGTGSTNAYGCPSSGNPQMYLIAKGGSTQGAGNGTNSAAVFIAALGKCSGISASTFIDMNEVTTVGTMAALQQYFNPTTEQFGYPASTQGTLGYANALTTIPNLVNIATGATNGATTITGQVDGVTAPITVNVLPEQAKINTIANITAACVNTTSNASTQCTTLFQNAYPTTFYQTSAVGNPSDPMTLPVGPPFATDVLQATYNMLTNPASESPLGTNNPTAMNNLFNLSVAAAPFMPTLSAVPTDWTIGIRYSSTSPCNYGTFLAAPYDLAVDATGNIWIASGGTSTTTSNLMALTPNGGAAICALGATGATAGVNLAKGLTIDTGNNVWIAGNFAGAPFYKYSNTNGTYTAFATGTGVVPYAVAADGSGNVFYTDATNKTVSEFVGAAAATTAVAPTTISTLNSATSASPFFMAIDVYGNVFVPNSTTTNYIYEIYPSTASANTNGYLTSAFGTATNVINPYAVAAGVGGNIYAGNSASASSSVSHTAYSFKDQASTGTPSFTSNTAQYAGGLGSPRGPNAVDGVGHIWYANSLAATGNYAAGTTTAAYNVSEFEYQSGIAALSPNGQTGGFQKDATIIASAPRALAIDLSGNVWGASNSGTGQGVFEIVGAAVPVVTPIAQSLQKSIAKNIADAVTEP